MLPKAELAACSLLCTEQVQSMLKQSRLGADEEGARAVVSLQQDSFVRSGALGLKPKNLIWAQPRRACAPW